MSIVQELLAENFVVIFTTRHCVECVQAKELLSHYFKDIKVYDVDSMDNGETVRNEVKTLYHRDTVPAVFVAGTFIGDLSDLRGLEKSGVLKMRIEKWKKMCPESFPQSPVNRVRSF